MAKQEMFGNINESAASMMPRVLLITCNSQKAVFAYVFIGFSPYKKANLHTIHTPLYLQMWKQLTRRGALYPPQEVTTRSRALMRHNNAACRRRRCQTHSEQLAKAHWRAKCLAVSPYFVLLWLDKGVVNSIAQGRGSRLSRSDGTSSRWRKRRRRWRLREWGGTITLRWDWSGAKTGTEGCEWDTEN